HLCDAVRGGGSDQQQFGPAGQLNVIDAALLGIAPLLDDHAMIGDRRESERRDKSRRVWSENDADIGAGIAQPAHQLGRFVRRDPAGDAENDVHRCPSLIENYSVSSSAVASSTGGVSCHFTWFLSISSIAT